MCGTRMLTVDDFVKIFGVFDVSRFHWDFYSGTPLRLNTLLKVSLFLVTCHETSREGGHYLLQSPNVARILAQF